MKAEALLSLAVTVAAERSVGAVLTYIAHGLANQPEVALARVWLVSKGDICSSCFMQDQCKDRTECLHLVATAGKSICEPGQDWSFLQGHFRRIPLGAFKVGTIGASGESILIKNVCEENKWIARPDWARQEQIRSFAGHPLIFQEKTLGVLAVFSREELDGQTFNWLRMFADQAAVAIANAQAFEEIERLKKRLELENAYLNEQVNEAFSFGEMIGQSSALQNAIRQIRMVAPTDVAVVITGESGTGKELAARAIHDSSRRSQRSLIRVNCASVPRDLFESEFFGHAKGSFTGAIRDRTGRFELADGGTIFLDEVAEIPLELQSKLLRVLQEGEFERLGEERSRRVNLRVISATNRNLKNDVKAGRFREDLYYRLCVFPVHLPPLRERPEDIPALAAHFLKLARKRLNLHGNVFLTQDAIKVLTGYDWPGNIRELHNVIERALILSQDGPLRVELLLGDNISKTRSRPSAAPATRSDNAVLSREDMKQLEIDNILAALEKSQWKVYGPGGAAETLGMNPTTLLSRIKRLGIKKPQAGAAGS